MRKIAISDIHGCAQSFRALIEDKLALEPADQLFLMGDYFSRGPDPDGVLQLVKYLKKKDHIKACLMGNHEHRMLLRMRSGHITIEKPYLKFISELKFFHEEDHYLLIHAGLNCALPNPLVGLYDILYARAWEENLSRGWLKDRVIIHGHERHAREEIEKRVAQKAAVLPIDNGCSTPDAHGQGALCALDFTNMELHFQPNIDGKKAPKDMYWKFGASVSD